MKYAFATACAEATVRQGQHDTKIYCNPCNPCTAIPMTTYQPKDKQQSLSTLAAKNQTHQPALRQSNHSINVAACSPALIPQRKRTETFVELEKYQKNLTRLQQSLLKSFLPMLVGRGGSTHLSMPRPCCPTVSSATLETHSDKETKSPMNT